MSVATQALLKIMLVFVQMGAALFALLIILIKPLKSLDKQEREDDNDEL